MIPKIKSGFFSDIPVSWFNSVAEAINALEEKEKEQEGKPNGTKNPDHSYRTLTVCEPCYDTDGQLCLKFSKVNCCCSMPTASQVIPMGQRVKATFVNDQLTAITFGATKVDVEPCDQ